MCFSRQTKQGWSNAWNKHIWPNKGMKTVPFPFQIASLWKWWAYLSHDDHNMTLQTTIMNYLKNHKINFENTNSDRDVCWTPNEINNRCPMTGCNSYRCSIIFWGPKMSPTFPEYNQHNNLKTHTGFFCSKSKRLPFQNIILETSLVQ